MQQTLRYQGMIWGKILRSPHAHAKILKLDTSKAEAMLRGDVRGNIR